MTGHRLGRVHLRSGERTFEVEVSRSSTAHAGAYRVKSGDGPEIEVRPFGAGEYVIDTAEGRRSVIVASDGDLRWLFVDGDVVVLERLRQQPPEQRRGRAGHHDTLTSPMPATVIRILVEPGRPVQRGDTLIVLEAMKMEMPLRAASDGIVQQLHCREGELVQPGAPLIEIE
jgi:geranyl-CoA carboxylase alpha subunit